MNKKLKFLSVGAIFFLGGQVVAQRASVDTTKTKNIDEVIMVGFGQKKAIKEMTGSVGVVGKEIAQSSAAPSVDKALAGRVAGVQTGFSSGQPGGAASIRVRGITSINGNNNPIIILDGVRISQGDLTSNTTTANILANLNSDDYESVTVLKDAVSTAVYGADAGAGVIIITTKSGRRGRARFNVNSEQGVSYAATKVPNPLSTTEWQHLMAAEIANTPAYITKFPGITPESAAQLAKDGKITATYKSLFNSTVNSDWKRATQNLGGAAFQNINGSVSGGSENLSYYSSVGYYNQESIIRSSYFKRISNTNRVNYKASDKLNLSTDIQLSYGELNALSNGGLFSNPLLGYLFSRPTDPIYNSDGSYYLGVGGRLSNNMFNTAALEDLNYTKAGTARAFANLQADYQILKDLKYKFVFAPEYINIEENKYYSPLHGDGLNYEGQAYQYSTRYFNFNVQNILTFDHRFADRNNFSISLIQEAYKTQKRLVGGGAQTVGTPFLQTMDNFVTPVETRGYKSQNSRDGYAAMVHYDYDKLFLLDISGRQDNLSNFWPGKKDGYFWSAGVGLDLARLQMIKSINAISQLKFSASYGKVGNILRDYQIPYTTYSYTSNYGDHAAAFIRNVDNPDLTWETVKPLNVGFDLGLFNSRVTLSAAYFNKKTDNLVTYLPLSPSQGGISITDATGTLQNAMLANVGSLVNKGFEITVGAKIFEDRNGFNWRIGANLSTLHNEVTALKDNKQIITGTSILKVGEAVNSFYMRKWAGVDPSNGNPLWYINGIDGATTSDYNKAQVAVQGSRIAKLYGGADTQLSYKGFAVDAQLSFGFGNKIYDSWARYLYNDGQYTSNYPGYENQLNYWSPSNPNALNPKPIIGGNKGTGTATANSASTRFLYKGDYLRLRVIKVSYTFAGDFVHDAGFSNLQIYLLGNNIWTHIYDKNLQSDPDLQIGGTSNLDIPPLKTYSIGVNLTF